MNKTMLHVGCGKQTKSDLKGFNDWNEIRLDIDSAVKPDVIGSITDMHSIDDGSVDAVYSSHNIEHVYTHEVGAVLSNFARVLNDNGFLLITCPDLQRVCELVLSKGLTTTVYESPAGPIAPLDIIYGHRPSVVTNSFMAHKCGFTAPVLIDCLYSAGFKQLYGGQVGLDLWFIAFKQDQGQEIGKQLARHFLP